MQRDRACSNRPSRGQDSQYPGRGPLSRRGVGDVATEERELPTEQDAVEAVEGDWLMRSPDEQGLYPPLKDLYAELRRLIGADDREIARAFEHARLLGINLYDARGLAERAFG